MFASKSSITSVLAQMRDTFHASGVVYLVGESSLVVEGLSDFCNEVILAADVDAADNVALCEAVDTAAQQVGLTVFIEHPADVIPLPARAGARSRSVAAFPDRGMDTLQFRHFDPYSVVIRFIARGDETDYHLALALLESGWITMEQLEQEVADLLPRFSFETIQQDPAEFRRKFKGLGQMWRAYAVERA